MTCGCRDISGHTFSTLQKCHYTVILKCGIRLPLWNVLRRQVISFLSHCKDIWKCYTAQNRASIVSESLMHELLHTPRFPESDYLHSYNTDIMLHKNHPNTTNGISSRGGRSYSFLFPLVCGSVTELCWVSVNSCLSVCVSVFVLWLTGNCPKSKASEKYWRISSRKWKNENAFF